MSRSFSITENPFVYGFMHESYSSTVQNCGIKPEDMELMSRSELTRVEKTGYYAGRSLRCLVSIIGSIADAALQFFQCVFLACEIALLKLEAKIRRCEEEDTLVYKISARCCFSGAIKLLRLYTTVDEMTYLSHDFRLIDENSRILDFAEEYKDYLLG